MANLPIVTNETVNKITAVYQINVEDFSTKAYKGSTIYVEIDILKFVKDEDRKNVVVEILEDEDYVYLTEFGTTDEVLNFEGLLAVAREWIAYHVKIAD